MKISLRFCKIVKLLVTRGEGVDKLLYSHRERRFLRYIYTSKTFDEAATRLRKTVRRCTNQAVADRVSDKKLIKNPRRLIKILRLLNGGGLL